MNKLHFLFITLSVLVTSIVGWKTVNDLETKPNTLKGITVDTSLTASNDLILMTKPCDSLHFCEQKIPLNKRIKGIIAKQEKHFFYLKRKNHEILQNAKIWFPLIEPILASYGIPEDFKYFTIVESNLTNSTSSQDAAGYWQLIPSTARSLGLIVNEEVDERYDPVKATHAACKYLKDSYRKLGNWSNVAASYNMGFGGLHKQLRKQNKKFYYNLVLNKETAQYVYKGIAVKKLLERNGKYSYRLAKLPKATPYVFFEVNKTIKDLTAFAKEYDTDLETLQKHNPWLKGTSLTFDANHSYTLKIPLETTQAITVALN